ncbi:MAG: hypothetical protein U0790_00085 [Isosphaeraceae bacterium]
MFATHNPPWLGLATGSTLFAFAGAAAESPAIVGGSLAAAALTALLGIARLIGEDRKARYRRDVQFKRLEIQRLRIQAERDRDRKGDGEPNGAG